jgi:hypothetical protein
LGRFIPEAKDFGVFSPNTFINLSIIQKKILEILEKGDVSIKDIFLIKKDTFTELNIQISKLTIIKWLEEAFNPKGDVISFDYFVKHFRYLNCYFSINLPGYVVNIKG